MKVPQNGWFIRKTILKWMIWGYHYFRKHPHRCGKHIWCIFQPVGHQLLCGQVSSYWTSRVTSMPPGSWSWLCFMSLGCCFFIFENMFSWENLRNTTWSWSNESPPKKSSAHSELPAVFFAPSWAREFRDVRILLVEKTAPKNTRFRCEKR